MFSSARFYIVAYNYDRTDQCVLLFGSLPDCVKLISQN